MPISLFSLYFFCLQCVFFRVSHRVFKKGWHCKELCVWGVFPTHPLFRSRNKGCGNREGHCPHFLLGTLDWKRDMPTHPRRSLSSEYFWTERYHASLPRMWLGFESRPAHCFWPATEKKSAKADCLRRKVRRPGIEPGSYPWQGCMIPLHHPDLILTPPPKSAYGCPAVPAWLAQLLPPPHAPPPSNCRCARQSASPNCMLQGRLHIQPWLKALTLWGCLPMQNSHVCLSFLVGMGNRMLLKWNSKGDTEYFERISHILYTSSTHFAHSFCFFRGGFSSFNCVFVVALCFDRSFLEPVLGVLQPLWGHFLSCWVFFSQIFLGDSGPQNHPNWLKMTPKNSPKRAVKAVYKWPEMAQNGWKWSQNAWLWPKKAEMICHGVTWNGQKLIRFWKKSRILHIF